MNASVRNFLNRFIDEFILTGISVESIILFGSQASGCAVASSDIDIAVVSRTELSPAERGVFLNLAPCIDPRYDVDIFFTGPEHIENADKVLDTNYHIKRDGVVLWPR